jgi:hypothetical protein
LTAAATSTDPAVAGRRLTTSFYFATSLCFPKDNEEGSLENCATGAEVDVLYLSTAGTFDRILRRRSNERCAIVEPHIIINIELGYQQIYPEHHKEAPFGCRYPESR